MLIIITTMHSIIHGRTRSLEKKSFKSENERIRPVKGSQKLCLANPKKVLLKVSPRVDFKDVFHSIEDRYVSN